MTSNRVTQIGIDRIIRLAWLEKTSSLVLAGNNSKIIKNMLQHDLRDFFHSNNIVARGSMDKTITILLKVWLTCPNELEPLLLEGLGLLMRLPQRKHLALHWGMIMAVYPFWSGVATQTGRLLRLQGSAAAAQVQRRIREQYGERETVSRATQRVLRSFLDWGVLQETSTKGIYSAGTTQAVNDSRLIAWLAEASLHARGGGSAPLQELIHSPSLFPFRIKPIQAESLVAASSRLDLIRHGLDDDLVMLRKKKNTNGSIDRTSSQRERLDL